MSLFRPSGGVLYHWRAFRHQWRWESFRQELRKWLGEWPNEARELILIGPSGGYTLNTEWLKKFERVYAFDLDPLAPLIFRRRHPGVNVTFERRDLLWEDAEFSTAGLEAALKRHPRAAVLFSNVLGQL